MPEGFSRLTIDNFVQQVGDKSPTPGGGAVASVVGALGAALARMVVSYTRGKKAFAQHEPALSGADRVLINAGGLMMRLAEEDAQAYGLVNELSRLPEDDPRREALPGAVAASVQVPLAVVAACVDLLRLFEQLAGSTNRHLRSDLAIAAILADASARASWWNIAVNADGAGEPGAAALAQACGLLAESAKRCAHVLSLCEAAP
ncbi:MAG: cyclodeaminase/cyclohydrolase family protein [Phycisphaerales bacterium]